MKSTATKDAQSDAQPSSSQQKDANPSEGPPAKKQKLGKQKPGPKAGHRSEDNKLYEQLVDDKSGLNAQRSEWQKEKLKQMTEGKNSIL